jgi:RNA polymerase sigma-70 factor (ECF subfamily)
MRSDEVLVQAVARGDEPALRELCGRWERPLYQFLFRHTGGRDVDDLYQETWLRVVRACNRFDPTRRFSTWLFQIAVNLCRDFHRRAPPEPVDVVPDVGSVAGIAATEAGIDARRLLAELPEAQRSVVRCATTMTSPEDEVAEVLGVPRGTVKSRQQNALARLGELAGRESTHGMIDDDIRRLLDGYVVPEPPRADGRRVRAARRCSRGTRDRAGVRSRGRSSSRSCRCPRSSRSTSSWCAARMICCICCCPLR